MDMYKIVLLGQHGVGKTTLIIQLCLNYFAEVKMNYDPMIEDDSYRKQMVVDERVCILEFIDTGGEEYYETFQDQWRRDIDGFLLLYSISSRSTFENVERYRDQIFHREGINTQVPLILVGNKCDMQTERIVTHIEGRELANRFHCKFMETSAKNNINVENAFHTIIREIRDSRSGLLEEGKQNEKKKKKKCLIL